MGKYKFSFLRYEFGILGLEYPDSAEKLADEVTCQEECISELLYPKNEEKSKFDKVNALLGLQYTLEYFERKLVLVQNIIEKIKNKISLYEPSR